MAKYHNLVFYYDPIFGMRFATVESIQAYTISTPNKGKVKKMTSPLTTNSYFHQKHSNKK